MSFTVTLIGADGSGKTTVARRLCAELPLPCRRLYMGVSTSSSNHMLPTTRLLGRWKRAAGGTVEDEGGPPDPDRRREPPRGMAGRAARSLRRGCRLLMLAGEEWYRQGLTWCHLARGRLVIYDRHFFVDYYAYDITRPRGLSERLHGFMLKHLYPRPQLVLFLDAPSEVLFARKGEGTLALLDRRRTDYYELRGQLPHLAVLDAAQPLDVVVSRAKEIILEHHRRQIGERGGSAAGPRAAGTTSTAPKT